MEKCKLLSQTYNDKTHMNEILVQHLIDKPEIEGLNAADAKHQVKMLKNKQSDKNVKFVQKLDIFYF